VVIVGAGPGGLAAAIEGQWDRLDTLLVEANTTPGGQAKFLSRIEDYPGFPIGVSGEDLTRTMFEQAERAGAQVKLGVRVIGLTYDDSAGLKRLTLSHGRIVEAHSVILANGVAFRRMDFPGSDGPGVIYGDEKMLAQEAAGSPAVVVGGSVEAAKVALVAAIECKHVYLLARSLIVDSMRTNVRDARSNPKITVIEGDQIAKLERDEDGKPGAIYTVGGRTLPTAAVGIFDSSAPDTSWLPEQVERDNTGRLVTDREFRTAIPGVFAIGDVRAGAIGNIGVAAGEGQVAMMNARAEVQRASGQKVIDPAPWSLGTE
jgi:thioredoxin reductase (NADPH)